MIYSISELEKLSGVKAHTIRAWEQRYQLLHPKRTETNTRYYEDGDLRLLLNVVFLKKHGFKISEIAMMKPQFITEKVQKISSEAKEKESLSEAMILAMMELDELKFHELLSKTIEEIGIEKAILNVVYPFLDKVSLLWLTGSMTSAHESFITCLIRQKLIVAIDALPYPKVHQKTFLLYTPEEDKQELSLLLIQYILKSRGYSTIYLGNNISISDLGAAIGTRMPDFALGFISSPLKNISLSTYIQQLTEACPNVHWLFTGIQVASLALNDSSNSTLLTGLNDTLDFISKL